MVRVIFASAGSGAAASVIIPCIDCFIPVMTIIHRYCAEGTVTRFIRYGDGILLISCRKCIVACVIRSCSNTVYQHGFQICFFYCKGLFFAVNFSVCNSFDNRFRRIESCTIGTEIGLISGLIGNLHIVDEIHLILGGDAEFAVCLRPIGDGGNFCPGQYLVASVIFDFGNAAQIICAGNLHINVLVEEQTKSDVVDKFLDRVFLKQYVTVRCSLINFYSTDCNCIGHLSDTVFEINRKAFGGLCKIQLS